MCLKPSIPSRKDGVEYPERSEIGIRKSVDFRKTTYFRKFEFPINYILIPGL